MKTLFAIILILGTVSPALAQANIAAHSHQALQNGQVLMFGDDHVEVTLEKNQVVLLVSDKFRKPVPLEETNLAVRFEGQETEPKIQRDPKVTGRALVSLPAGAEKIKLSVSLTRKNPPRTHISDPKAQTIEVEATTRTSGGH
jgi:hypothetical protein